MDISSDIHEKTDDDMCTLSFNKDLKSNNKMVVDDFLIMDNPIQRIERQKNSFKLFRNLEISIKTIKTNDNFKKFLGIASYFKNFFEVLLYSYLKLDYIHFSSEDLELKYKRPYYIDTDTNEMKLEEITENSPLFVGSFFFTQNDKMNNRSVKELQAERIAIEKFDEIISNWFDKKMI